MSTNYFIRSVAQEDEVRRTRRSGCFALVTDGELQDELLDELRSFPFPATKSYLNPNLKALNVLDSFYVAPNTFLKSNSKA